MRNVERDLLPVSVAMWHIVGLMEIGPDLAYSVEGHIQRLAHAQMEFNFVNRKSIANFRSLSTNQIH
jgi:hypothetical protein